MSSEKSLVSLPQPFALFHSNYSRRGNTDDVHKMTSLFSFFSACRSASLEDNWSFFDVAFPYVLFWDQQPSSVPLSPSKRLFLSTRGEWVWSYPDPDDEKGEDEGDGSGGEDVAFTLALNDDVRFRVRTLEFTEVRGRRLAIRWPMLVLVGDRDLFVSRRKIFLLLGRLENAVTIATNDF